MLIKYAVVNVLRHLVSRIQEKAKAIYSGLVAKGYADAIFRVAMMYEYGRGENRNLLIAQVYYQDAIAKGDMDQKKKYKNYYKLFLRRNHM